MRMIVPALALVLLAPGLAAAQEFAEFANIEDGFKIDFPGTPKVTPISWTSEHGFVLPGRVYAADRGREHYSVTVVDYGGIEQMGIERAKKCPPGAEPCLGSGLAGIGYWKHDVRGAIIFATQKFMSQPGAQVTEFTWQQQDLVEGHQVQIVKPDGSRSFAFITMHKMKLFVVEGTVPKGYPAPALFQNSMGWVDANGNGIRYQTMYNNEFHGMGVYPVPAVGGGGDGAGGAGGGGGRQGGGRQGGGAGGRGGPNANAY